MIDCVQVSCSRVGSLDVCYRAQYNQLNVADVVRIVGVIKCRAELNDVPGTSTRMQVQVRRRATTEVTCTLVCDDAMHFVANVGVDAASLSDEQLIDCAPPTHVVSVHPCVRFVRRHSDNS
jgi:acyl-CoA hydrolase